MVSSGVFNGILDYAFHLKEPYLKSVFWAVEFIQYNELNIIEYANGYSSFVININSLVQRLKLIYRDFPKLIANKLNTQKLQF